MTSLLWGWYRVTITRLTKVAGKAAVNGTETDVQVQYTYDRDRLTKITHNGFDYTFAYDGFGNRKSVSIAGKAAVSHDYEAKNGNLLKSTFNFKLCLIRRINKWK